MTDCKICGKVNAERYHFQKNHNPSKSKEVLKKISDKAKQRYKDPKYREKMLKILNSSKVKSVQSLKRKEWYKNATLEQKQRLRQKKSRNAKRQWESGNKGYHPNKILASNRGKGRRTRVEILMKKGLDSRGISYREEVKIGKYFPDFLVNKNIVVECDEPYWHPANNLHDKKRDEYMIVNGYKVLRFANDEIEKSLDKCLERIEEELGK